MDLEEEILKEHSKNHTLKLAAYIGSDPEKFKKLVYLLLNRPLKVTQRASWILSYCADEHPELVTIHLEGLIKNLRNPVHDAVKRNTLRMLQNIEIPNELLGETADLCFKFLASKNEPIAIKVFSMAILNNICRKEPELTNELRILIEDQLPYQSPGFVSRGRKILNGIS